MKLNIDRVIGHEHPTQERIRLFTSGTCNLKDYALLEVIVDEQGKISNQKGHMYFFPDLPIADGDLVMLYTSEGVNQCTPMQAGKSQKLINLYWGLPEPIWHQDKKDKAMLVKVSGQQMKNILPDSSDPYLHYKEPA